MHFKIDEYYEIDGVIQKLNPALKLSFIVIIPLAASLATVRNPLKLFLLLLFTLILAGVSKIPLKTFIKRSIPALPFIIYAAAVFIYGQIYGVSLFMSGGSAATGFFDRDMTGLLHSWPRFKTFEQAFALSLLLKILISLNAVIVFSAATAFKELSAALYFFRMPEIFVKLFKNTWRYLQSFINELMTMNCAARLRFFAPKSLFRVKTFAMMFSMLFIKSLSRAEFNNISMRLRGGGGRRPEAGGVKMAGLRGVDYKFIAVSAVCAAIFACA